MRNLFLKILLLVTFISSGQSIELLHQLKKGQQRSEKAQDLSDSFTTRVNADSGTSESTQGCFEAIAYTVDEASIVFSPAAFKASKLYSVEPTDGVGDFTVIRASVATRINSAGLIEEMADNVPRLDYPIINGIVQSCSELLLEPQSINLYLNSELNNVENTTVTATPYNVFLYGTGTITFSGAFVGTLVGTGVNDKVEVTFTPSAGTLISTDSGSVDKKQIENLEYSTSYIKTIGSTVTRLKDRVTGAGDVNTFNGAEGVLFIEIAALGFDSSFNVVSISDGTTNEVVAIFYTANTKSIQYNVKKSGTSVFIGSVSNITFPPLEFHKIALKYKSGDFAFWIDGTEIVVGTENMADLILNVFDFSDVGGVQNPFFGRVRDLKIFKTALTDAELVVLTCPDGETCLNLIPFILIGFKRRRKTEYKLAA